MTVFDFLEQANIFDVFLALLPYEDTRFFQLLYLFFVFALMLITYFYAALSIRITVTVGASVVFPMTLLWIVGLADNGLITTVIFTILFIFCFIVFWRLEEYIESATIALLSASLAIELAVQFGILEITADGIKATTSGIEGLLLYITVLLIGSTVGVLISVLRFKDLLYIIPGTIISVLFLPQIVLEIAVRLYLPWYIDLYLNLSYINYILGFIIGLIFGIASLAIQFMIWSFFLVESEKPSTIKILWYVVVVIGVSSALYLVAHLSQSTVDSLNEPLQRFSQEQDLVESSLLDSYRGDPSTSQPTERDWRQPDAVRLLESTKFKQCPHLTDCQTLYTMQAGEYLRVTVPDVFGQDINGNNIWHFSIIEIENERIVGAYFHSETVTPCNLPYRFAGERIIDYGVQCVEHSD